MKPDRLEKIGRRITTVGIGFAFVGLALLPFAAMLGPDNRIAAPIAIFWMAWTGIMVLGGIFIEQQAD